MVNIVVMDKIDSRLMNILSHVMNILFVCAVNTPTPSEEEDTYIYIRYHPAL